MRILHITTIGEKAVLERLPVETDMGGGIGKNLLDFMKVSNGTKSCINTVTCCAEGLFTQEVRKNGIDVRIIRSRWIRFLGKPLFVLLSISQLIKIMKVKQINIVHAYNLAAALAGGIAAKIIGIPMIISVHQDISEYVTSSKNKIRRFLSLMRGKTNIKIYKIASRFGKSIIVVSNYVKESLIKNGFNVSKVSVIYEGINVNGHIREKKNLKFREEIGVDANSLLVGAVGRLHPVKGFSYLIQAARDVIVEMPQVKFVLIGDGEERNNLKALVNKFKLSKNFIFAGHRENVSDILTEIDLFVSSSLSEGFGIAILEAMLASKATITTRVGAVPELIEDKKTGILVPAENSRLLADAIISLLENKKLSDELAKNGYQRAVNNFSLDKQIDETFKVYSEVLRK